MKKKRILELLELKETVSQKDASDLVKKLDGEIKKCDQIFSSLDQLQQEKAQVLGHMNAYIYQTERYLIEKIVEQKEITRNRIEFLNGEVNFAISSLREIQSKINKIEKMKEQENKNMIRTALDKLDREILENRKR
jgi:hypothetical protein